MENGIKAIIFDMGGVLMDLDMPACRKEFMENLGYRHTDSMLDTSHGKGLYMEIEGGKITPEEFREKILEDSRPGGTSDMVDRAMWALLDGIRPDKAILLKQLSAQYDLYLLSNNNPISWIRCCELFEDAGIPVSGIFKRIFLSFSMKMLKPSREIFEAVIRSIPEHAPSEMLFIDDSEINVRMASMTGLKALHCPQTDDLRQSLSRIITF